MLNAIIKRHLLSQNRPLFLTLTLGSGHIGSNPSFFIKTNHVFQFNLYWKPKNTRCVFKASCHKEYIEKRSATNFKLKQQVLTSNAARTLKCKFWTFLSYNIITTISIAFLYDIRNVMLLVLLLKTISMVIFIRNFLFFFLNIGYRFHNMFSLQIHGIL